MKLIELPNYFAINTLNLIRQCKPFVYCITNTVVQNITANALLALGAIPFIVIEQKEAKQFSTIVDALLVNVGTLCQQIEKTILIAIQSANQSKIPWVLDPVGINMLDYRKNFVLHILSMKPTVIRGNIPEIMTLFDHKLYTKHNTNNINYKKISFIAQEIAQKYNSIVVVTGKIDIITDGFKIWKIQDGDPFMAKVIGTGCILSAIITSCCALSGNKLDHIAAACRLMSRAGKLTARTTSGPGSFSVKILDTLYQLQTKDLE